MDNNNPRKPMQGQPGQGQGQGQNRPNQGGFGQNKPGQGQGQGQNQGGQKQGQTNR